MNRTTKIALAAVGGVLVVGGVAYVVTRPAPKKKNGKSNGKNGGSNGKKPGRVKIKLSRLPVWNDSMAEEVERIAREEYELAGEPTWSEIENVKLARKVAKRVYPQAPSTTEDTWPASAAASDQWLAEAQKTKPKFTGAVAWQKIYFITGGVMGYTPVT